jgi:hypothetical protein
MLSVINDRLSTTGAYGIEQGDHFRGLFGSSLRADFDRKFFDGVLRFTSSLYSFCDYKEAPNARWENTPCFKAGKYLTAQAYPALLRPIRQNTDAQKVAIYPYARRRTYLQF